MIIDHALLHGVKLSVGGFQRFDGKQGLAVECRQEQDAGIDRAISQRLAIELGDDHGTGAAITLGASLLAADTTQIFA